MALLLCLTLAASVGAAGPSAQAAKRKSLYISDTASLHLTRKSGSILYESGTARGTLPGTVSARFDTSNAAKVTGSVTFYSSGGGSITVNVVGYPTSVGRVSRFSGSLAVRSGTGRFSRALGSGSFSGSVNRRTWAISVTARASITY